MRGKETAFSSKIGVYYSRTVVAGAREINGGSNSAVGLGGALFALAVGSEGEPIPFVSRGLRAMFALLAIRASVRPEGELTFFWKGVFGRLGVIRNGGQGRNWWAVRGVPVS